MHRISPVGVSVLFIDMYVCMYIHIPYPRSEYTDTLYFYFVFLSQTRPARQKVAEDEACDVYGEGVFSFFFLLVTQYSYLNCGE